VYENETNTFSVLQQIFGAFTTPGLVVTNSSVDAGAWGVSGFGAGGGGVSGQSINGIALSGSTINGLGLQTGSSTNSMAKFWYSTSANTRLALENTAIVPGTAMDLGTITAPFESLFVSNINVTTTHLGKATFPASDTITVYSLSGVDSNSVGFVDFIDRVPFLATLSLKTYNDGHIEITSSTGSMLGHRVQYFVRRSSF
jgi:hypothetical protein